MLRSERRAGTPLGKKVQEYLDRGQLVPDDVMVGVIRNRLEQPDTGNGFLLDGFPRTVAQADALDEMLGGLGRRIDRVIYLKVPEAELVRRLSGRLSCPTCNRTYHIAFNPPRQDRRCNFDGTELFQRPDDQEQVARDRVQVYLRDTVPVLEYYRRDGLVAEVDGTAGIDEVRDQIIAALDGAVGG
jgi:adenylate kinase